MQLGCAKFLNEVERVEWFKAGEGHFEHLL